MRYDMSKTLETTLLKARELESGAVEVSAVDPQASMQAVENPALGEVDDNFTIIARKSGNLPLNFSHGRGFMMNNQGKMA